MRCWGLGDVMESCSSRRSDKHEKLMLASGLLGRDDEHVLLMLRTECRKLKNLLLLLRRKEVRSFRGVSELGLMVGEDE